MTRRHYVHHLLDDMIFLNMVVNKLKCAVSCMKEFGV